MKPADNWRLGIIALAVLIFSIAWPLTPISIEWATFCRAFLLIGFVAGIGLTYRGLNRDEGIAAACLVMAQILLFSKFAALNNYLGLELRRPLIDELLAGIDRSAGIDWWAYVTSVKSDPFRRILTYAYQSSVWQLAAAILLLGFTRRSARLDMLSLSFMISESITIAVWVLFPSFGALPLHYAQGLPDPAFDLVMSKKEAMQQLALHAGRCRRCASAI
jgi:PAP2 superfamily